MTIKVKYCGGCNPRFGRVAAVARLRASLPGVKFPEGDAPEPDYTVIVCGCPSRCANPGTPGGRLGAFTVSAQKDMDRLMETLRNITRS